MKLLAPLADKIGMSKIGKKSITIADGVEVKLDKNHLDIKGPKGSLSLDFHEKVKVEVGEKEISVKRSSDNDQSKLAASLWGLTRSLINNMMIGVSEGYEKKIEL